MNDFHDANQQTTKSTPMFALKNFRRNYFRRKKELFHSFRDFLLFPSEYCSTIRILSRHNFGKFKLKQNVRNNSKNVGKTAVKLSMCSLN